MYLTIKLFTEIKKTDISSNSCGNDNDHSPISANEQLCQGVLMSSLSGGLNQHSSTQKLERPTSLMGANKISFKNISFRGEQCEYFYTMDITTIYSQSIF